jgi:hypothetical protein
MLTFDFPTNQIASKLNRSLYCINKVKHFLPALCSLWFALIHSHLSYCLIITSCANNSNIIKMAKLQKKAIHIISNKHYLEHTVPLFKSLNILSYQQLIIFSKLNFMQSVIYTIASKYFDNIRITNNEREEKVTKLMKC